MHTVQGRVPPQGRRAVTAHEVRIILRRNPDEPITGPGPTVYEHIDGQTPVVAVSHPDAVDPAEVGHAVLDLLRLPEDDGGDAA